MEQSQNGTCTETDIFETQPDVDQHANSCNDNRNDCILTHFITYGRRNAFCGDCGFIHTKFFIQFLAKLGSLIQRQFSCLDDNLIGTAYLGSLDICIAGYFLYNRFYFFIDLFDGVIFVEGYVCRSTAHKLKAVVQCFSTALAVDQHGNRTGDHAYDRDCKEYLLMFQKINGAMFFRASIVFHILKSESIKCLCQISGDNQCGEHGQDDTHCQCVCETFYGTGSHDTQHDRCDQGCDISVQDCRQCFFETDIDRTFHGFAGCDFFTDTCIDDNVCIDRHTDTKDDTCDTRQSQCDIKCI